MSFYSGPRSAPHRVPWCITSCECDWYFDGIHKEYVTLGTVRMHWAEGILPYSWILIYAQQGSVLHLQCVMRHEQAFSVLSSFRAWREEGAPAEVQVLMAKRRLGWSSIAVDLQMPKVVKAGGWLELILKHPRCLNSTTTAIEVTNLGKIHEKVFCFAK